MELNNCGSGGSPQTGQAANGAIATLAFSPSGPPLANPDTVTATAVEAGQCHVTFTDGNGLSVTLTINVTTTSVTVNGKKPVAAPHPAPQPGVAPVITPIVRPAHH